MLVATLVLAQAIALEAARIVRYRKGLPAATDVVLEPWTTSGADAHRLPRICDP
jgi:hypothetical protein